mmetsp:Transcript_35607/g.114867  ORF Transcript_35607/g.114867 Transcript_35607/m.114867 type:complete len:368 (-) Transcript_35607:198-1301(-)
MPIRPNFGPRAHSHSSPPTHWLRGAVESAGAAAAARLVGSPPPPPLSRWRMSSRRAATSASQRGKGTPLENSRNRRSHECEWYTSPQNRSSRPKPSSRERASSDRAGTSSDASSPPNERASPSRLAPPCTSPALAPTPDASQTASRRDTRPHRRSPPRSPRPSRSARRKKRMAALMTHIVSTDRSPSLAAATSARASSTRRRVTTWARLPRAASARGPWRLSADSLGVMPAAAAATGSGGARPSEARARMPRSGDASGARVSAMHCTRMEASTGWSRRREMKRSEAAPPARLLSRSASWTVVMRGGLNLMSSASRSKKTCSCGSVGSGSRSRSSTKRTNPGCDATSLCSAGAEACTHLCTQEASPRR